jgi:hypothetical protein
MIRGRWLSATGPSAVSLSSEATQCRSMLKFGLVQSAPVYYEGGGASKAAQGLGLTLAFEFHSDDGHPKSRSLAGMQQRSG